jgi:hypothetical protein
MTDSSERKARGRPRKTTSHEDIEVTEATQVEELLQANQEFNEENDRLRRELAEAKTALKAKDYVAATVGYNDALNHQVGQDGVARFDGETLVKPAQSTLDDPNMIKKADILRFMEDMVTVEISEVSEDQADIAFPIMVDGKTELFRRGERKAVKRYFVEGLARAKKTGYRNQLVVDRQTGEQTYEYPAKTGLRYPFSVIHDPSPRGADWLKAVLRQP